MNTAAHKSYRKTIRSVQAELPPLERSLSRLIHNRLVWRIGELGERLFFRVVPTALGYITALACGLLFIAIAFMFNYPVNSLGILFLIFIIGYAAGVIVDYMRLLSR